MMQGYCPLFGPTDFKHQEILGAILAFQRRLVKEPVSEAHWRGAGMLEMS